jgi:hypothetical protein
VRTTALPLAPDDQLEETTEEVDAQPDRCIHPSDETDQQHEHLESNPEGGVLTTLPERTCQRVGPQPPEQEVNDHNSSADAQ